MIPTTYNSHRRLFSTGGSLLALFGSAEVAALQDESARLRADQGYPVCECWRCGELRPDDLDDCPNCGAECTPF